MKNWYALYTKPRSEKKAAERLAKNEIEVYCPLKTEMRQWSDRKKKVEVPFFPSYIFVRIENFEKERLDILQEPNVLNFVFWLRKPAIIRDEEMKSIQDFIGKYGTQNIVNEAIAVGAEITLDDGPFKGQTGIVEKLGGKKIYLVIPALGCQLVVTRNTNYEL